MPRVRLQNRTEERSYLKRGSNFRFISSVVLHGYGFVTVLIASVSFIETFLIFWSLISLSLWIFLVSSTTRYIKYYLY